MSLSEQQVMFRPIPSVDVVMIANPQETTSDYLPSGRIEISNPFTAMHEVYYLFIQTRHTEEDKIDYHLLKELIKRSVLHEIAAIWDRDYGSDYTRAHDLIHDLGWKRLIQDYVVMPEELRGYPHRYLFPIGQGLWMEKIYPDTPSNELSTRIAGRVEMGERVIGLRPVTLENCDHKEIFASDEDFVARVTQAWQANFPHRDLSMIVSVLNQKS